MDGGRLGGGFLSVPTGGLLDLETPIRGQPQAETHFAESSMTQPHMNLMIGLENDHHRLIHLMEVGSSTPRGVTADFIGEGKVSIGVSGNDNDVVHRDDDEASLEDGNGESCAKGKKGLSPWHRMKWRDDVVRLLIVAVAYVGDDGVPDSVEGLKRKPGVFQKKGKWTTVSKLMICRGCHVSPQQCEDKFNDLNKRYKRLNDILGRGTSCKVVENPALMDSMPKLSPKAKDDVKKILSSKHLFYKEMCAYHNGQRIPNCQNLDLHLEGGCKDDDATNDEVEGSDDSDDDSDDEDSDDDDDDDNKECHDGNENYDRRRKGKMGDHDKPRSFGVETRGVFQYQSKESSERKEWIKKQLLQLREENLTIQVQKLELEKRRLKWLRYRNKKSRELERLRLENERKTLENERWILELKQKELKINPRLSTPMMEMDQGRDEIDLSRRQ